MEKVSYRPHRCTFIVCSCLSIPRIVKTTSQERGKSSGIYNVWVKVGSLHWRYAMPYTESHRWDAEIVMQGFMVCVMQEVRVGWLSSSVQPQTEWISSIWPGILGMVIGDGRGKLSKAVENKQFKRKKKKRRPSFFFFFPPSLNLSLSAALKFVIIRGELILLRRVVWGKRKTRGITFVCSPQERTLII